MANIKYYIEGKVISMKLAKKIISKKDIIIPKGTVFENIDGSSSQFYNDNYAVYIELDKDTTARVIVPSDNKEYFAEEVIK